MSIKGVAWEGGLSSQQEYSISSQRDRRTRTQEAGTTIQRSRQSWIKRMGKEVQAALLATSYALTATNM